MNTMPGIAFPNLPYNTSKIYAHAIDKSGCKIYIPGTTVEQVKNTKVLIQEFLDAQPDPPDTEIPPPSYA